MKRSHRVALTAVAATAALAGGGSALAFGPLTAHTAATPVTGAETAALALDQGPAADPSQLHNAVSRLTKEVADLSRELDTARRQHAAAGAAAKAAAAEATASGPGPAQVAHSAPTNRSAPSQRSTPTTRSASSTRSAPTPQRGATHTAAPAPTHATTQSPSVHTTTGASSAGPGSQGEGSDD